jgi:hypothetical protein
MAASLQEQQCLMELLGVAFWVGEGDLLHYSSVASETLESASKAPAAEVAASACLRRASALAGLGLELWG